VEDSVVRSDLTLRSEGFISPAMGGKNLISAESLLLNVSIDIFVIY